jgi:hypothetical protein
MERDRARQRSALARIAAAMNDLLGEKLRWENSVVKKLVIQRFGAAGAAISIDSDRSFEIQRGGGIGIFSGVLSHGGAPESRFTFYERVQAQVSENIGKKAPLATEPHPGVTWPEPRPNRTIPATKWPSPAATVANT